MNRYLSLCLFFLICIGGSAQSDEEFLMEKAVKSVKRELTMEYNIGTIDILPSLDGVKGDRPVSVDTLKAWEEQLKEKPQDIHLYYNIGCGYDNLYLPEKGKEFLDKGEKIALELLREHPDSSGLASSLGLIYAEQSQFHKSADWFLEAYRINPKDTIATYFGLISLVSTGNMNKAKEFATTIIRDNPQDANSYFWLFMSNYFETMQELMTLEEDVAKEKVRNIPPTELFDISFLNLALEKFPGDYRLKILQKMIITLATLSKAYFTIEDVIDGKPVFVFSKTDQQTLDHLEKFFKEASKNKDFKNKFGIFKTMGLIAFMQKDYTNAIKYYEKAIKDFPSDKNTRLSNTAAAYLTLMTAYHMKDDEASIRKVLDRKIIDRPQIDSSADDFAHLAYFALKDGDLSQAQKHCRTAININPQNEAAYRVMAVIRMQEKNYQEAEAELTKAYNINKESDNTYFLMGVNYLLKKEEKLSEYMFKKVRDLSPDWEDGNAVISRFHPQLIPEEKEE